MYARMRSPNYRSFLVGNVTSGTLGTAICGWPLLSNATWGIAFNALTPTDDAIAVDEEVVLIYNCDKIMVPKLTGAGTAWLVGQKVYVTPATLLCYAAAAKAAPTDVCIGIATMPQAAADDLGEIDLKGDSMTDQA